MILKRRACCGAFIILVILNYFAFEITAKIAFKRVFKVYSRLSAIVMKLGLIHLRNLEAQYIESADI